MGPAEPNYTPPTEPFTIRTITVSELSAMNDLFYGPGESMPGGKMTDEQAMAYAQKTFPRGDYCLVRQWRWIDLDVSDQQRAELAKTKRLPVIIYASRVVFDSNRRWDVGDFVRTSPLHAFEKGFHFKTLNSTYLLLGAGVRKLANAESVAHIF
jgi:hypothetical protein